MSKVSKLGLFGILVPHDLGGAGADLHTLVIATEELSISSASMALLISFHNIICDTLVASNNLKLKRALFSKLVSGSLGSLSLDPTSRITYKPSAKGLVLNGSIDYALGASTANVFLILAKRVDSVDKIILAFSKDQILKSGEFSVGNVAQHLGMKAAGAAKIEFRDVKLPSDVVLFEESETPGALDNILAEIRLVIAAQALGIGKAAIRALTGYARKRPSPKPYSQGSAEDIIALALVNLETSRCLCYSAANKSKSDSTIQRDSAIARVSASSAALNAATQIIRICGGQIPNVDQYLRDATATQNLIESESSLRQADRRLCFGLRRLFQKLRNTE